jgi:23S rRNA (adenine2030-N6)-methyltransferase
MNYRHLYHAGNHTEVVKHSVLCLLLHELQRKPNPFAVLDTHAGAGKYDLSSPEAQTTGEAQDGIGKVIDRAIPAAAIYLDIVRRLNPAGLRYYPGSPAIVQSLLRENDRLIACELREDDAALLRANFRNDRRVSIHHRDGYEAIGALVPLATKRGLVFIDPPFEQKDEFQQLADAMIGGIKKWPTGIFAAWYPLKDRTGAKVLRKAFRAELPPTLCCEFLRQPLDGITLAGGGIVICNPPWRFESRLATLCSELAPALGAERAQHALDWWVAEGG